MATDPITRTLEAPPVAANQPLISTGSTQIQDVKRRNTPVNTTLWLAAISLLIGATIGGERLQAFWPAASNIWVQVGVIALMVITALGLMLMTNQGHGFVRLTGASRLELRRITWPPKEETFRSTWLVLLLTLILALTMWGLDTAFGWIVKLIVG